VYNGSYAGDTSAWRVITGSANWVAGSLTRSDELQLRVEGRPAHANYLRNWRSVRDVSRRVGG